MPPSTSAARDDEPLRIELELVRAEAADDAFAFRFARQTYLVRGPGGAYETAELPWSRELLRDLEEIRRPDRDPATVARMGDMLRELLGAAGWARHEAAIVEARAARRRVHVTIRSAAAELYALPWELLTLRADGQHLGALDHVLLRYAWPGTSTVAADEGDGPARLLVAWSAAGGGVPAAEQVKAIGEAAKASGCEDAVEVLPRASYGAIAEALEAATASGRPFRALHLLCHGAEAGSTFGVALEAEGGEGRPAVVDAGRLQQLLAPHAHALRLVVVAACDGGNMGEPGNRIGSVAQRLHRAGVRYVIASRYPLSARGSTRIAGALHQALLGGESVERAFVAARAAAAREVAQLDWASLQLYARPEDGDRGCVLAGANAGAGISADAATSGAAAAVVVAPAARTSAPASDAAIAAEPVRTSGLGKLVPIALGLAAIVGIGLYLAYGRNEDPTPAPDSKHAAAPAAPIEPEPEPTPPPSPSPSPNTDREASTGDDAQTTGASGSADPTGSAPPEPVPAPKPDPGSVTPKPSPQPTPAKPSKPTPATKPAISTARPSNRCSKGLKEHIDDRLGAPTSGRYSLEIWAREDGSVTLHACPECGEEAARARTGLAKVKAGAVTSSWKDELPCRVTIDWQ